MTLESVSRALTRLARDKIIAFARKGRREVRIPDADALSAFVQRCIAPVPHQSHYWYIEYRLGRCFMNTQPPVLRLIHMLSIACASSARLKGLSNSSQAEGVSRAESSNSEEKPDIRRMAMPGKRC